MKKLIHTGVLGILLTGTANASIISRSFLDEALTNYATNTALDLKANQRDFSALNAQISDGVDLLRELFTSGASSYGYVSDINPNKFSNDIVGAFDLLYQYINQLANSFITGWNSDIFGIRYEGFSGLNDVIGTLPNILTNYYYDDAGQLVYTKIPASEVFDTISIGRILEGIFNGFLIDGRKISIFETSTRTMKLSEQIGELPTEYATVGAALSAIKGIAEEAKAAALAAIPDPKTEGASGKYVLTVDIVGDNATYTWEKIDRSTVTVE